MRLRVDQIVQDARFGLRQLRRSPLVAVAAIVTLAIGIGLNTAVFSLVHAVLLRPLPYPHGERLVWIAPYSERWRMETQASRGDYLVWKQHTDVFERMAAYGTQDLNLIVGGEPSQERIASIGGDFWDITGAVPVRPSDARRRRAGHPVVVGPLSTALRRRADGHRTGGGNQRRALHDRRRAAVDIPGNVSATNGTRR
jgi:MacB-like periplasmic core domain